ncbi:glycerophosphodiester phosphodiesterase family protein [Lacinutrix sp. MedPE-SW]|uniref:glycerophosphodiester phosphodiesterase n=1 Tax=Lacinutrix sp. MedPE-SW TaxID=1860087 RepID=UPI00090F72E2|nr:glycerophosphodiester phosphodiesterase family protein [Lacinutrix sp. MedPE-SW]OIQ23355.1 MAG: glycerophosphodiester phosphodiesterase [Lacinutrix sp. MedPE-SW]
MQPLKIGHRGAKGYVAENTLESINKALALKVDGIEIDVHKCKSGELVVFHDFTLDRITNGVDEVSKFTLQELKSLKVDGQYQIPTLQEVLKTINRSCFLNIELKGKNTAAKTVDIIEYYVLNENWEYSDFIVSSFQHQELKEVYSLNNKIPLAVLTKANLEEAITFAKTINTKILHPNFALLSESNVKRAQSNGYIINTWTVNTPKAIARMKKYKVNAIISDYPDRV